DLLLALERDDECEAIVRRYDGATRPRIVRVPAMGRPRSRSQAVRRRHRVEALERYLAAAAAVDIDVARIMLQTAAGAALTTGEGALCGLDDARGNTLALGVVEAVEGGTLRVLTPLAPATAVRSVRIGRERRDGTSVAPAPARHAATRADDGRDD